MNIKQKLKDKFRETAKREPSIAEEVNLETDALLMVKILREIIEDHEKRLQNLEK